MRKLFPALFLMPIFMTSCDEIGSKKQLEILKEDHIMSSNYITSINNRLFEKLEAKRIDENTKAIMERWWSSIQQIRYPFHEMMYSLDSLYMALPNSALLSTRKQTRSLFDYLTDRCTKPPANSLTL